MLRCAVLWLGVVGALASYPREDRYYGHREGGGYKEVGYKKQYVYYGKYGGTCKSDGLYYRDDASFVICTNGIDYIQPCAPGTKNRNEDSYDYGGGYDTRDFCAVNLVDYGYGTKGKSYGKPVEVKTVVKAYEKGKERNHGYHEREHGYKDNSYHDQGYHGDSYGYPSRSSYHDDGYKGYGEKKAYKVKEHYVRYDDKDGYGRQDSYGHDSYGPPRHGGGYEDDYKGYPVRSYGGGYPERHQRGYEYGPKYEVERYSKGYAKKNYGYERKNYQDHERPYPRH